MPAFIIRILNILISEMHKYNKIIITPKTLTTFPGYNCLGAVPRNAWRHV